MRRLLLPLALLVATPAHADQLAGNWRVSGAVIGHAFVLDCSFASAGGGTCTETGTGDKLGHAGKVHVLTRTTLTGNHAGWSYPVSVFLMHFEMTFTGTLTGNQISGAASAAGRQGTFTAIRTR